LSKKKDVTTVRELASRVAEIAALPVQEEKRGMWRKLNARDPVRPMVMIDQVCWNEMNIDDELTLTCTDGVCRLYEDHLRRILYQWQHCPVDMVVEPFVRVHKAIHNLGLGMVVHEEIAVTDPTNAIVSHQYENQFQTEEDLEKIRMPAVSHDAAGTDRRMDIAHELFDGLLEVRPSGADPYLSLWDPIAMWMGVENALYALVDQPDLMHGLLDRMTNAYLSMLDQLEEEGLLCEPQSLIHCTGAYTDELPASDYDPQKPMTKDIWMFGLAQMLSTVSPDMFREFEVDYTSRLCERFGLVYYGCCDPLDGKMDGVRMLPNVRKVSMSPWVNKQRAAAEIGRDFVYSCKPNPAFLATEQFNPDQIRADLTETRAVCEENGCPLEIILKDISTVRYEPERLFEWARVAMQVVGG
jgi:hypothetical protein